VKLSGYGPCLFVGLTVIYLIMTRRAGAGKESQVPTLTMPSVKKDAPGANLTASAGQTTGFLESVSQFLSGGRPPEPEKTILGWTKRYTKSGLPVLRPTVRMPGEPMYNPYLEEGESPFHPR